MTVICVVYSDLKKFSEYFCSIIFYNYRIGLSRQECMDELKSLFGEEAPSYSSVKNWFNEFKRGSSLKYELREGPSKTAVVSENIDAVRELIMQDRHVTCREIWGFLPPAYIQYCINNWP